MSLAEEARFAGRGVLALLLGQRDAPSYFNLTLHGLVGSFIAMLAVFLVGSAYSIASSPPELDLHLWHLFLTFSFTYGAIFLAIAFMLSQFNRREKLVPYLVASSWSSVVGSILSVIGFALGQTGANVWSLVIFVAIIVVEVNIARFIIGLTLWKIVGFLVGQFVAIMAIQMIIVIITMTPLNGA